MQWRIRREVVQTICLAAQKAYPNEFIALLGGNKDEKLIEELVILPSVFGSEHAMIRMDLLPPNARTVGSVHSHPTRLAQPSPQDLAMFAGTGWIHLIVGYPHAPECIRSFDALGKPVPLLILNANETP